MITDCVSLDAHKRSPGHTRLAVLAVLLTDLVWLLNHGRVSTRSKSALECFVHWRAITK